MSSRSSPETVSRWLFPYLGAVNFITAIGNLGLVAVMPAIGRMLDIPDYLIACVFSLSAFTWAVSSPYWSSRVEHYGPELFVRAGILGFIVSMGGIALGVELGRRGWVAPIGAFLIFLILRAIFGLFGAAAATASQSLAALNADGARRTRIISELLGATTLGLVVGPAIAPLMIVDPLGPIGPMLGFSIFGAIALAMSFVFMKPSSQPRPVKVLDKAQVSLIAVWRKKHIGRHLTFGMIVASAQAINLYTIGFVLIDRMGEAAFGAQSLIVIAMTGGAIAALIAQWGVVRIFALKPSVMMGLGAFCALLGNLFPIINASAEAAVEGFILASFGFGLARPGFAAAASLSGVREDQVAIAAAVSMIAGASIAIPPIIAAIGYQLWVLAPFVLSASLLAYLLLSLLPEQLQKRRIVHHEQ